MNVSGDVFNALVGGMTAWNQVGLFFGGMFMLAIGGLMLADFIWWRVTADQFAGKITGVLWNGKVYYPVIEYTSSLGAKIQAHTNSGSSFLASKYPGRQVTILVKPHDPETARIKGYVWFTLGIIFVVPGIVLIGVALTAYEVSLYTIFIGLAVLGYGGYKVAMSIKPKEERESISDFQIRKRKERQKEREKMQSLYEREIRERLAKQDKANRKMVPIMMLVSLALIGGGYYLGNDLYRMELGGMHAEGTVIKHERVSDAGSNGSTYYPVVLFKDEQGNEVTFKDKVGSSHPTDKRGDIVSVLYLSQLPKAAMIDRGLWNWLPSLAIGGAGLLLFIVCIRSYRGINRRAN